MDIAVDCPNALHGDPLRLEQILINLIGNAIKFTEHGEIYVEVRWDKEASDLTVESVTCPADNRIALVFTVQDTGIGMSQEQIGQR